jgi:glycosyltransferase involved in cell wall biosynthesis
MVNDGVTSIRRIAMLGNHLPRHCGIATFTTDLADAIARATPAAECFVLAVNDAGRRHAYPPRVQFEITEPDLISYRRAADFLNVTGVDVLSVQHEYGIFGGKAGSHVLTLLRGLRMPIVTTLHTLLATPNERQRQVMDELAELSSRLVTMTDEGATLLHEVHRVPRAKIDVIPHGIPSLPEGDRKDQLGVAGKSVLLTFGLLSPDKGIEYVIDAMPAILARHPDVVYIVLGATHPHVRERAGESYRLGLVARAARLGISGNVIFHDRFVSTVELTEFLSAADIYVTPYLNMEQSTSGTLAYAVGGGRAVISTPYRHARELLADGRGILVPRADAAAIAREVNGLLDDDTKRTSLSARAAEYGADKLWPSVARAYIGSFERACADHKQDRARHRAHAPVTLAAELPEVNFEHLRVMTDHTGLLQHADFSIPRYATGYCLDDNARALLLMALAEDSGTDDPRLVRVLGSRYLAFVNHAFEPKSRRFRNFMSYSRAWEEDVGSDDCHGRAIWALGTVVGRSSDPGRQSLAGWLFQTGLPPVLELSSPRSWAYALLGIAEYLRAFWGDSQVQAAQATLANRLLELFRRGSSRDWPWCEDRLTYCNARLPQALIATSEWLDDDNMREVGVRSLDWLVALQTTEGGYFAPIGCNGFYLKGGTKARFDQQPVEVGSTVSACLDARRITGDARWLVHARRAFDWFLGQNELQRPLYDAATGACHDGLHADRINANQGAESTLSFLLSLFELRSVDRIGAMRRPIGPRPNGPMLLS